MIRYDPGDVVLVRFPFTDLATAKKRPALILSPPEYSNHYGDVVVLALTSQDQSDDGLRLQNVQQAGLPKPTWFKPLIGTLASSAIVRRLGTLAREDQLRVANAVGLMISAQFAPRPAPPTPGRAP